MMADWAKELAPGQVVYDAYTDGSVGPTNPGAGGYAWLLLDPSGAETERRSAGLPWPQTNNTAELMAAIDLLEWLPPGTAVRVHSDSEYVVKGYTLYAEKWVLNGWRTSAGKDVANSDLWRRLLRAGAVHYPTFHHVKGHDGHAHNETCDELARMACRLYYNTCPSTLVVGGQPA